MITSQGSSSGNPVKGVSRETLERLTVFHDLLKQWQSRINLISPTTLNHIWERHIGDSLQICAVAGAASRVTDIGSGAGFPGLVQAILLAEAGQGRVDLIESNGKKCSFMRTVIRETGLRAAGVECVVHNDRIEKILPTLERPQVITARALSSLNALLGLTEICLTAGTIGVFPKGRDHPSELVLAREHWSFDVETIPSDLEEGSVVLKISDLKPR